MSNTLSTIVPALAKAISTAGDQSLSKTSQSTAIPLPGKSDVNLVKIVVNLKFG